MPNKSRVGLSLVLLGALILVSACTTLSRDFGYAPSESQLAEIVVGIDGKVRVEELVGSPLSESLRGTEVWYYTAYRQETFAFKEPVITERQIVAISFDQNETVRNIERFALQDGRVVTLTRRVTEDAVPSVGLIRQIFGNIGGFSAEQIVGN